MKTSYNSAEIKHHKEREGLYFHILLTKDSSPTCFTSTSPEGEAESMHSLQGAYTETNFIYGSAAESCFQNAREKYHILNLGVGIGYNELSVICYALKNNIAIEKVFIDSFELYPELQKALIDFLYGKPHSFLGEFHEQIISLYVNDFKLEKKQILDFAKTLIEKKQWTNFGPLEPELLTDRKYDLMLFDAYSQNSSPELWTSDFLDAILKLTKPNCVFTTYAATGQLKRSLKKANFHLKKREGFAFKRESTLAIKKASES